MDWPDNWQDRVSGAACPACVAGRFEESDEPPLARFFAGDVADAYLVLGTVQRGWAVVLWHGRHVVEPTELTLAEAADYGRELLVVARAMQEHFKPVKLNYQLLGNDAPHLHTSVTMRFAGADDVAPGEDILPSQFVATGDRAVVSESQARFDVKALRRLTVAEITT